jgi:hypothetical protein
MDDDKQQENKAEAQPAVLRMTIGITRKATGLTETYELTSEPIPQHEPKEAE